ncbi:MAG: glycosyltransferase family 2 protein [Devosia sp.]|nr:glycosyltransferase family 2 protein [Devosia sp.]
MTSPTHSVIIPVRNGARHIRACLDSVLAELGPDDEVIVTDNGSTDDTVARVAAIGDKRIVLLHEERPGPAAARNTAIRAAQGRYICFQDHDDLWPPGRQQRLLDALLATPGANAAYGRVRVIFEGPVDPAYAAMDGQYVHLHNFLPALFERSLIARTGLLDETMLHGEDVDYLVRLRQAGMVAAACDAIVHIRRRHDSNWSSADPALVRASTMQILHRNIARRRART